MHKIRMAAIIILTITTLFFGAFTFIQRGHAKDAIIEAEQQRTLAKANAERAERELEQAQQLAAEARLAENNEAIARRELEKLEEELKACRER